MSEFESIDNIVVAKLGTNLLSTIEEDGTEHLDAEVFDLVGESIRSAQETGTHVVLVTSAAIAAGMAITGTAPRPDKETHMTELQYLSAVGWPLLVNEYQRVLPKQLVVPVQITRGDLLSQFQASNRMEMMTTIYTTLAHGNIPVINENDAISHTEITFGDNDKLAGILAANIGGRNVGRTALFGSNVELVLLTDVDGLYENAEDPSTLIPEITDINDARQYIKPSTKKNSSGDMDSKLDAAEEARAGRVVTYIANGHEPNAIVRVKQREIGTYIPLAA